MLLHRMRFSLFQYIAGVSALFGAPLFCVGAWQITSNWANDYSAGIPFGRNVLAWIFDRRDKRLFLSVGIERETHFPEMASWDIALLSLRLLGGSFVPKFHFLHRRLADSLTGPYHDVVNPFCWRGILDLLVAIITRRVASDPSRQMVHGRQDSRSDDPPSYMDPQLRPPSSSIDKPATDRC